ncbi:neuronal acetylcholine receptor subunit alpha-5-like [Ylistrum balloti]|uniref:neuronal acetylcholine receptor subunit alpha-5-like n=1 Tax=Ylistrum balloti TaxID=509963 RepID=UPI0029057FBF|nr:neuronal acetylcholine receptor subunit alpha-5-like [Ylistrum balloti]
MPHLILTAFLACTCQQYTFQKENDLRTLLFENQSYNMFARPRVKVEITVSLNIINFNDLNIRDQQLTTTGYFILKWKDDRLFWDKNPLYRKDVTVLFTTEEHVWRPALVIENSVSDISAMSDIGSPILLTTKGTLTWRLSGIFTTYCEVDISLYPFDTQICSIRVTSLGYSANEIELFFSDTPVDTRDLNENGEWIYTGFSTSKGLVRRELLTHSELTFDFQLKRRPLYHIMNTLVPTISLAFLTCMVFKLPAESGERIGYSLTVVLSYAVYLTLVADNIPSSSTTVSVLSIYLVTTLILGMLSVLLTILVLDCHHADHSRPVPKLLRQFCRMDIMITICAKLKPRKKVADSADDTSKSHSDIPSSVDISLQDVTWQDLARKLDRMFLWWYIAIVTMGTMSLVIALNTGYQN